ncbi:ice-binding family protein [Brumimicrobium glaciale]|nr:ice-binding family protein [Brumimicrobium glaciale]
MKNENAVPGFNKVGSFIKTNSEVSKIDCEKGVLPVHNIVQHWKVKTGLYRFIGILLIATFIPLLSFSQPLNLGTAENFVLFTSNGAIGNTGTSLVNGNMGTNVGAVTDFGAPSVVNGGTEIANSKTAQAVTDVQAAYDEGAALAATHTGHAPAFGTETLLPGVYHIAGAGSVGGDLTLDAQNDPSAIFVLRFGGAFSTGAASKVILVNGTKASNVFWLGAGAMSMAANTEMKGIILSLTGAVSMGDNVQLEGRMLTTSGAISMNNGGVTSPEPSSPLPIGLLSFAADRNKESVVLKWSTASETNNDYFNIEKSIDGKLWNTIGNVNGAGNSTSQIDYSLTDRTHIEEITYYRLKQTDFDGKYSYEDVISIDICDYHEDASLTIYPNPTDGKIEMRFHGNSSDVNSIGIFNSRGQQIYSSKTLQSEFDLSGNSPGLYFMHVQYDAKVLTSKFVISE